MYPHHQYNSIYNAPPKLDFNDVLIVPKVSNIASRAEVNLNSSYLLEKFGIDTTGIIAANMNGTGTFEIASALKKYGCMTAIHKHYSIESLIEFFTTDDSSHSFYSLGISEQDLAKFVKFVDAYEIRSSIDKLKICCDVANGYMEAFGEFCGDIKKQHPSAIVMAGNVVDRNGLYNLRYADVVKMGIGQGSNCLTRTQTGIGYPQFSCIYDVFNLHPEPQQLICSDGGCVTPGDISKAFAAGASMVMLGGMLAGTDEGGGDIIEMNNQKYVEFYGMSSATAQKKHNGGLKEYRSSEGRTTLVPYKGSVSNIIQDILGGLRSTCAYVGASSIDELHSRASFMRVNSVLNKSMEKFTTGN